ncbi:MAG: DUF1648 domain-containing protein [Acidobacteriota bacterium]|nr:DUF1648 domain-containing protein [Acidobacteriota bacterium]
MRKSLEAIALVALALLVWITYDALTGPNRLPDRIPTHFDAAGNANGWGSPAAMILLPIVAIGLYFAMSVTALFPGAFHYPVRATRMSLPRLQDITLDMMSWLKAELSGFFAILQWAIIRAARSGQGSLFALLVPALLVVVFSTIGWHFVAILRAAKAAARPITPPNQPTE